MKMVIPRKVFKEEYKKILKARNEKNKAIENLNNYLSKIKSEDSDVTKLDTDIQSFIEKKPISNSRSNAVNKYFKVQAPTKKAKRESKLAT